MNFTEYQKTLPLSRELYEKLFGTPKTHEEWTESFNKVGEINEVLIKTLQ